MKSINAKWVWAMVLLALTFGFVLQMWYQRATAPDPALQHWMQSPWPKDGVAPRPGGR